MNIEALVDLLIADIRNNGIVGVNSRLAKGQRVFVTGVMKKLRTDVRFCSANIAPVYATWKKPITGRETLQVFEVVLIGTAPQGLSWMLQLREGDVVRAAGTLDPPGASGRPALDVERFGDQLLAIAALHSPSIISGPERDENVVLAQYQDCACLEDILVSKDADPGVALCQPVFQRVDAAFIQRLGEVLGGAVPLQGDEHEPCLAYRLREGSSIGSAFCSLCEIVLQCCEEANQPGYIKCTHFSLVDMTVVQISSVGGKTCCYLCFSWNGVYKGAVESYSNAQDVDRRMGYCGILLNLRDGNYALRLNALTNDGLIYWSWQLDGDSQSYRII